MIFSNTRNNNDDDDVVGRGEGADVRAHRLHQRLDEVGALGHAVHQNGEAGLEWVGVRGGRVCVVSVCVCVCVCVCVVVVVVVCV